MSHRDDCPDRWEARRQGERAFERGYGSNPYRSRLGEDGCPDAEREWRSGYYAAERRAEEERAEMAADRRRAEARREEANLQAAWDQQYAQQYAQEPQPEPEPQEEPPR